MRQRGGGVLYVLSFVPTYVQWEVGELVRRGIPVCTVLPPAWPRASMWQQITGFAPGASDGPVVRAADFHAWLARPIDSLARPAGVLLRRSRRRVRGLPRLAARCLRDGTFRHFLAALWLADLLQAERFTRIHSHFATDPAQVGALLAQLTGVPFTLTTHAADIFQPRVPRRLSRLLASTAQVFTISNFNRAYLEQRVGSIRGRVRVLHLGVDIDALPRWSPPRDAFTIVCTASGLGEKKGVSVLLEACRLLQAKGVRFQCQILGADPSGERLERLRLQVRERGLQTEVRLLGAVAWRDAQQAVSRASVFVHPSVRTEEGDMDGIPVSLIEAMGIGAPVIASRLSGIPELVEHGRNGILLAPGDAGALADALERMARHPAPAQSMGQQARHRVREAFALSRYVDGLLDAWGETAVGGPAGAVRSA
jgi:glycosyltransferase involved in cell wall biosynthesis